MLFFGRLCYFVTVIDLNYNVFLIKVRDGFDEMETCSVSDGFYISKPFILF